MNPYEATTSAIRAAHGRAFDMVDRASAVTDPTARQKSRLVVLRAMSSALGSALFDAQTSNWPGAREHLNRAQRFANLSGVKVAQQTVARARERAEGLKV